jgi:hypothetical protein
MPPNQQEQFNLVTMDDLIQFVHYVHNNNDCDEYCHEFGHTCVYCKAEQLLKGLGLPKDQNGKS